jgi:hypothetical protein
MKGLRRAGLALAIFALAIGQAQSGHAQGPDTAPFPGPRLVLGVHADADLAGAQPVRMAAAKPTYLDKPCSFVPAKNPVKPKKNACRFV